MKGYSSCHLLNSYFILTLLWPQIMPTFAGLCVPPTPIIFPNLGSAIDLRLGAGGLQLFGLPLAGYGTRLQMPMNALPAQQP